MTLKFFLMLPFNGHVNRFIALTDEQGQTLVNSGDTSHLYIRGPKKMKLYAWDEVSEEISGLINPAVNNIEFEF